MNIPNVLTVMRLILVPLFLVVVFSNIPNAIWIALLIFLIAGLTDVLDGHLARKYHMVTKQGSVLDPLADKLMSIAVLFSITMKNFIPVWVLSTLVIKETLLILGGIILYKRGKYLPARPYGKAATVSMYIAVVTVLFSRNLGLIFMYITVGLALYSFCMYFKCFLKLIRDKR